MIFVRLEQKTQPPNIALVSKDLMVFFSLLFLPQSQSSPRILNTHAHFELMPREVLTKKDCKLVYVTRDPRDVAVSYFNHHRKLVQYYSYEGQWKDYLPMFLAGNGMNAGTEWAREIVSRKYCLSYVQIMFLAAFVIQDYNVIANFKRYGSHKKNPNNNCIYDQ